MPASIPTRRLALSLPALAALLLSAATPASFAQSASAPVVPTAPPPGAPNAEAARPGANNATLAPAAPLPKMPSPPYLSPADSLATIQLPPGYRMELVLSEPDIAEPVVTAFDGNGRIYVAEMRTYMQDIDANNEKAATSRVSLHWSSKNDGVYDRHSVFVDKMLLPRMILPLRDSVLIQETDTGDVFEYRDTNQDGVADDKKLFHSFEARRGANLEHQPSGLIWALDNWIYTTYNAERVRWTPNGAIKEPTGPNGGQWGLAQDNNGKPWFINTSGEIGPLNFQQPIVYGSFRVANELTEGFKEVFPLVGLADVQGGRPRFRPEDKTLNHITAVCGIDVYRGDRLPADLSGDVLFGEPVGRLIRRAKVEVRDGITYLRNAYEKTEFIRSTDAYFRPVNLVTAPDGTIYITDMYRGIIQEGNWTRRGSYLRSVIEQYGMDKNVGRGRVWRLVHDSAKPGPMPRMLDETPAQLVAHLAHPNGWWRDTAQKLIILSQDKSVAPALRDLARKSDNPLARTHAIWTLEGLGAFDAALAREKFQDANADVRIAAVRASETLVKQGDASLAGDILARTKDAHPNVVIQTLMTAQHLKFPEAKTLMTKTAQTNPVPGIKEIVAQLISPLGGEIGAQFGGAQRAQLERGKQIYLELCFACHSIDGRGTSIEGRDATLAPPLAGSATVNGHRDALVNVLLHGIGGPINGKTYEAQMAPMGANDDAWIAAIASYLRTSFGNNAPLVSTQDVARLRAANPNRKDAWTQPELETRVPRALTNQSTWKLTSNRPADNAAVTLPFTAEPAIGATLQIELPEKTPLAELRLGSLKTPQNAARGYKVELSVDGETWTEVGSGRSPTPVLEVSFPPAEAKFVRITHPQPAAFFGGGGGGGGGGPGGPGGQNRPWMVDELTLFRPATASAQ